MDINLTTPALLFPAVSLLMLAFTNRFLALAALIRTLDLWCNSFTGWSVYFWTRVCFRPPCFTGLHRP
jgi:hypothetical protein